VQRGTRACLLGDARLEAVDLGSVGHLTRHTRLGELRRRLQRPSDLRLPRRRLCSVVPQATGVRCMMKRGRGRRKGPTSLLASCRSYCLRSVSNLHARSNAGGEILARALYTGCEEGARSVRTAGRRRRRGQPPPAAGRPPAPTDRHSARRSTWFSLRMRPQDPCAVGIPRLTLSRSSAAIRSLARSRSLLTISSAASLADTASSVGRAVLSYCAERARHRPLWMKERGRPHQSAGCVRVWSPRSRRELTAAPPPDLCTGSAAAPARIPCVHPNAERMSGHTQNNSIATVGSLTAPLAP
jgi:hypothetical protein